jgi:hypothetical protein
MSPAACWAAHLALYKVPICPAAIHGVPKLISLESDLARVYNTDNKNLELGGNYISDHIACIFG